MELKLYTWITILITIIWSTGSVEYVHAQSETASIQSISSLEGYPFILVADEASAADDLMIPESEFHRIATGVQFVVNRTEVDTQSEFFRMYRDELLPLLRREHLYLVKIFIRGAASPEGSYDNNRRLSIGRSQNLLNILSKDLSCDGITPRRVETKVVTEDYSYLVALMKEANDPDAAAIEALMDSCQWDERACKNALRKMQRGTVWKRLLAEYFPRLRAARVVLLLKRMRPAPPKILAVISSSPISIPQAEEPTGHNIDIALEAAPEAEWRRIHMVGLRTNLLHDGFYMPQFGWAPSLNVQLEYYPLKGHYTYNAAFTWSNHKHWSDYEFFQIRDLQLEVRRYFRGKATFLGPYLGLYAQGGKYGIGLSQTKGWQGEGGGAGLSVGYVLPISRNGHWRLELMAAVGGYLTHYDPYVYGNPITNKIDGDYYYDYLGSASDFKERNHRFTWFGPTNVGLQVTYDILYHRKRLVQKGDNL